MVLKAFVMIKLKSGTVQQAIEAIRVLPGARHICTMTGEHDLLVEFEGEDTAQLHDFHFKLDGIDAIDGVITNVVMKEFEP